MNEVEIDLDQRLQATLAELRRLGSPANIAGRARFGIPISAGYGVAVPELRRLARKVGRDHHLAARLWSEGSLDARLLAAFIDDPRDVGPEQMDRWAKEFDSWAICDGCCQDLFRRTASAWSMAFAWTRRPEEYVKRAGFAMFAELATHDREAPDGRFRRALARVRAESRDERKYVRKGVNWALRGIGKRNEALLRNAILTAEEIARIDSPAARWIASDALRELRRVAQRPRRPVRATARPPTSRRKRPGSLSRGTRSRARSTPSSPSRRLVARR